MSLATDHHNAPLLLLVHGWGLGPGVWQAMRRLLPSWPCLTVNLGFFSTPQLQIPDDRPLLAVGHSLGFLWLLRQLPAAPWRSHCLGLLGIAAFSRFARAADFDEGVPPRLLQRMRQRLPEDPAAVLQAFAQQGGMAITPPDKVADPTALLQGLAWLAEWDGRQTLQQWPGLVANLAARDDQVVPPLLSERCFTPAQQHWLQEGGHLLPLTRPEACARFVQQFLPGSCGVFC
ncbi:MAG: alpha/beta hydrolase [Magnetococcales bacterium]|nr:alpha/beta hydrolase [Magnetococcales bacterium]